MAWAVKRGKKSGIAEESGKIAEAREKLKKKLAAIESRLRPEAIERKRQEILRTIHANLEGRVVIPTKMALFDGNNNSAQLSLKVRRVMERLENELEQTAKRDS